MDELTPGKKLIFDLLAKSIAKVQAAEAKNQDAKTDVQIIDKKSHKSSKKQVQEDEVKIEEKENVTKIVKKERKHRYYNPLTRHACTVYYIPHQGLINQLCCICSLSGSACFHS